VGRFISAESRADLDVLLNESLPFAKHLLEKNGEFYPFGVSMGIKGDSRHCAGYDGKEFPPSDALIDLIERGLGQEAKMGQIRAACICMDVRVLRQSETEKVDAIKMVFEHLTGDAVEVFLPYERGSAGNIEYGEMFAQKRVPTIFHAGEAGR